MPYLVDCGPMTSMTIKETVKSTQLVFTYEEFKDVCARAEAKPGSIKINAAVSNLGFTNDELDTILAAKHAAQKDSGAGIQAGQNVYLYGKNVILDGLVQSGYDTYKTALSAGVDSDASRVTLLDQQWQKNKVSLKDDQVLGNERYLVNGGGSYYNADRGVWEYEVKVYYNPSTQKLLTESVNPGGGKIYITGALASTTGTGRLVAMDGTPTISIDTTQVSRDLSVGTIRNQESDGLISIKDTNKNTLTEYRNNNGVITAETTPTDGQGTSTSNTYDAGSVVYQPTAQTMKWTGGTSGDETVEKKAYTKNFTLWSLVKYRTTDEFLKSIDTSTGKLETTTSYLPSGTLLGQSTLITSGGQTPEYQISTAKYSGTKTYSEVVETKKYNNWTHFAGQITYSWTETTPSSTSSTYSIQADKPIGISFLQGTDDAITIAGSKNVDLTGSITSAGNGGTVTLTSQKGGIEGQNGAVINTDSLTASALQDISLNHSALGDTANISLESDQGSVSLLSGNGNLNIKEASAQNGDLYLRADGNLQSGAVLMGNRIDLVSKRGAITADVAAATNPLDSDPLSASINAQAEGNITLANNNGNMRIGHIISNSGDVSLTTNGSFEDAVGDGTLSGSSDKMALWKEMGLVSDADADDSRTAAAAASKQERLDALNIQGAKLAAESRSNHTLADYKAEASAYAVYAAGSEELQAAKKAYETKVKALKSEAAAMTEEERQAAFDEASKPYDEARKAYFEGKGYSAEEQDFILNYSEVNGSDAYGWNRNDLLYAIQDSVLNASPKDEVVMVTTPNIKGKNITLNAGKNIGVDGAAREIAYADLNKLENLQILSQAKAGDLTWNDTSLTVRQQPVTLQLNGGKVTLNANSSNTAGAGSIYLAGVKDTALDITGKISTSADVKLMSDKGVKMEEGGITARNLTITGGTGDIGSSAHNILTNLSGSLDARTQGNLYLHQTGLDNRGAQALTLQSVAGSVVNLSADAGMKMTTENGKTSGYINGDEVNLVSSDGSLGLANDGLRVKNTGVLSADAEKGNIYLSGKDAGTLTLANVKGKDEFVLTSEGTVKAGREAADGVTAVDSQIKTARKVTLDAAGSIDLAKGSLTTDTLALKAGGHISQSAGHAITAPTVSLDTVSGIDLKSGAELDNQKVFNDFQNVTVKNGSDATDVIIGSGGSQDLTVSFDTDSKAKNVTVRNYKNGAVNNLTVNGPVTVAEGISLINDEADLKTTGILTVGSGRLHEQAAGALENEDSLTGDDIILNSTKGMINKSLIATHKVELTAANDILNQGIVQAGTSVSMKSDTGSITNKGDVEAKGGDVTMGAKTDLHNQGVVKASQDVGLTSGQSMANEQAVTAGWNLKMKAGTMLTNSGGLTATNGSIELTAQKELLNQGAVQAGTSVTMTSAASSITNKGDVEAKGGDVTMDAKTDLGNQGAVTASQSVGLTSGQSMTNDKAVTASQDLTMDAGTTLTNGGGLTATDGSIELTAQKGLRQNGNATAGSSITMDNQQDGNLVVTGDVQSGTAATIKNQNGDVTIDGQVEAKTGDATVKTGSGDVLVKGKLEAGSDAILQSDNGSVTMGGNVQAGRDLQASTQNGGIVFQGNVESGRDLTASASQGDITFDGRVEAGRNLDARTQQEGTITLRQDVTVGGDLRFATNDGSIRFEGNDSQKVEDIHVTSKDGDVSMTITGRGNMEDSHRQTGGDRAVVEAGSGNITLKHTGVGDVDLYSLLAGKKAGVEVEDGSLYLDTINGDLIAVYVKNPQKTTAIEHMEAGSRLSLSGSTIHVAEISQRPGASSTLTLDVDGADQAAPVESLTIGDIKAAHGVRIPHLWVRNGAVKTSQGTLQLDKLFVLDKATFSNGTMITDVFGTTPRTDERVHSVYWINTKLGRPQENLSQWLAEAGRGGRWMYLLFDRQGHTQFSNGNLVDLDPHNYVYNQRYSETNWTRTMEDRDFSNFWTPYFHPELTYSSRYDLVDGSQAVSQPANGEITVEEV